MERFVSWEQIKEQISSWDRSKKYFGVPRGGMYIAALLNPVDRPEDADIIVDDLIDSGATRDRYQQIFPDKPFMAVFEKDHSRPEWIRFPWEKEGKQEIEENVLRILEYFDDPTREGLRETPKRYIKFLTEFLNPPEFSFTTFDSEGMDEMIIETDIPFFSLCEHHLAPFFGFAYIAYIPNGKIVGLSKIPRTLELYSRGFQNQERITQQVADRLLQELDPKGVAVVLKAQHLCMSMRGVKKPGTWTTTSKMIGTFREDAQCRNEFLKLISKS